MNEMKNETVLATYNKADIIDISYKNNREFINIY